VFVVGLNGLSYAFVAVILFYSFFHFCFREKNIQKVGNIFGVNGIFFLIFALLHFSWAFNYLEPIEIDFIFMNFILTTITSMLLLYSAYKITSNKNLVYIFMLFITSIFAINLAIGQFYIFSMIIAYIVMLIVYFEFTFRSNYFLKKSGIYGVVGVVISSFYLLLLFFGYDYSNLAWYIPNLFIGFSFYLIYLDLKNMGIIGTPPVKKEASMVDVSLTYFKFIIFIVSIGAFALLSTVSFHELGHALTAQYYGCEHTKAVIYDILGNPHTEIECSLEFNDVILTLAGLLSTLAVSGIFFLTGGNFTSKLSYLLLGFSFFISYGDLIELGVSKNLAFASMFFSIIILIIAIVKISKYYLGQQHIFLPHHEDEIINGEKVHDGKAGKIETSNANLKKRYSKN